MTEIYTDGGARPNPGIGGWSYIRVLLDGSTISSSGCEHGTTNNRMEILAAIKALEDCEEKEIKIYSDSSYLVDTMTKGWKRKKNFDLWIRLDKLVNGRKITFVHVNGHGNNDLNNRCDALCTLQIDMAGSGISN